MSAASPVMDRPPLDPAGFEHLNRCAAALLDPLLDAQDDVVQPRLAEALEVLAQSATALGLPGLAALAQQAAERLHAWSAADWNRWQASVEEWVADVIAFCAGHLDPAAGAGLCDAPQQWLSDTPPAAASLMTERLREEALRIGAAAAAGIGAQSTAPAQAQDVADAGVRIARDELALLLDAVDALEEECLLPLAGLPWPAGAERQADALALIEDCAAGLARLAEAMRQLGLTPLAQGLAGPIAALHDWQRMPAAVDSAAVDRLQTVLGALAAFLRSPDASAQGHFLMACADPYWPAPDASLPAAQATPIPLELVASRQVDGEPAALSPEDVSLALPVDVDADVLDSLLRELPPLAAEFSGLIEGLADPAGRTAGWQDVLAQARRVAHTLKGAANTVGIRGIAVLTHRLEDLLQLLGDRAQPPDRVVGALLAEAADCLGEMSDAVAGLGEAPRNALALCGALGQQVQHLLAEVGDQALTAMTAEPDPRSTDAAPERAAALSDGETLRVPAVLLDRVLDLAAEAGILLARVQEQVAQLGEVRQAFRNDSDRLRDLAGELERLVDVRGVNLSGRLGRSGFDPLELDEYDELHTVSRQIAEAGADARILDQQLDRQGAGLGDVLGQLERVQTELREAVMRSRTLPVRALLPRLQRVVRQAARMSGRQVVLQVEGEDTAVDARLLQSLLDPLAHLLRNAIDHGIESPAQRLQAGKPPTGRVTLSFQRDGRRLTVRCRDDGRGLDLEAIRIRAQAAGLIDASEQPDADELARLVLLPGFSTRQQATQLSGRGIGLEVVQRTVRRLRGRLSLSGVQSGLQVTIDVPEGLVAIPVLLVRAAGLVLALSIRGVERILPAQGALRWESGALWFVDGSQTIAATRLEALIGWPEGHFAREAEQSDARGRRRAAAVRQPADGEVALLVRRADGARTAVIAPAPGQTRNLVVRQLPVWMPAIAGIEGATVLGDGAVATVLDLPTLLMPGAALKPTLHAEQPARQLPLCLVADDSVSVRRAMSQFLEDLGFEVDAVADGSDALASARTRVPALAIVDLEMPRMNGIELCRALREDPALCAVPVIMITSRSTERHRALALQAGVDAFLVKPYTEDELAAEIRRCLVARPALG